MEEQGSIVLQKKMILTLFTFIFAIMSGIYVVGNNFSNSELLVEATGDEAIESNTNIIAFNELKYFTGLTAIAESAFYGCTNLWKVQLPNTIETIHRTAFSGLDYITNITIPNKVTDIQYETFYGCDRLKTINLPKWGKVFLSID